MDDYYPDGDRKSTFNVYGYAAAQTLEAVLRQAKGDYSRENLMKQAASLKDLRIDMLLPGVLINTSATDFAPIEQMQLIKFNGTTWEPFGEIIDGSKAGS